MSRGYDLAVLVLVDKLTHLYSPARDATLYTMTGPYSWIFWALQIGLVIVIPLAILFNKRLNASIGWIVLASILVVIGVFFERYYLVIPAAAYPMEYYPGNIEGVWGAIPSLRLTPVEVMLSVGIIALMAFLFMLGLKYLELLPPEEKMEALEESNDITSEENEPEITGETAAATGD